MIDDCLRLCVAHGIAPDEIAVTLADNPVPASISETQLNLQYAVAAALVHGKLGAAEMDDAAAAWPKTRVLQGRGGRWSKQVPESRMLRRPAGSARRFDIDFVSHL